MEEFINVILTVVQFSVRDRCSEVAFSYFCPLAPFWLRHDASGTCAQLGYYVVLVKVFSAGELGS